MTMMTRWWRDDDEMMTRWWQRPLIGSVRLWQDSCQGGGRSASGEAFPHTDLDTSAVQPFLIYIFLFSWTFCFPWSSFLLTLSLFPHTDFRYISGPIIFHHLYLFVIIIIIIVPPLTEHISPKLSNNCRPLDTTLNLHGQHMGATSELHGKHLE